MKVELRFWEAFTEVTKSFQTVEEALLYYRKYKNKGTFRRPCKEKESQVNWFGGEYRFETGNGWSQWHKIN
jgi:hypothetical protein